MIDEANRDGERRNIRGIVHWNHEKTYIKYIFIIFFHFIKIKFLYNKLIRFINLIYRL